MLHYNYFMKTYLPKLWSASDLTGRVSHWLYLHHTSVWIPTLQCKTMPMVISLPNIVHFCHLERVSNSFFILFIQNQAYS